MSVTSWLERAASDPAGLPDDGYVALLAADGAELEALCALADAVRARAVGDALTVVANRNLETRAVAADPELLDALVDEAAALGATEVCVQGPLPAGLVGDGYLDLVERITRRQPLHLHAFRPAEVDDAARRAGCSPREWLAAARDAGLGSVPGTAARILDDRVRTRLLGRPDLSVARWLELITTAHDVGLPSTATMLYGHIETPAQQVAHLRLLAEIQDRTGGFTEFIAMPLLPDTFPGAVVPEHLRDDYRGADERETRAVHAVARLLLHGRIPHVQVAWTKLAPELVPALLAGGADDLGGLLLDGSLAPGAGPEAGRELTIGDVERLADALGRTVRQRTTTYGDPPPERRLPRGGLVP